MKLHSIGQDLKNYQNFFGLVKQYPVHPVNPVKIKNSNVIEISFRSNGQFFRPAAGLNTEY